MPEAHALYSEFGSLPPDILLVILAHADLQTVLAAERVCSAWRSLIHDETSVWRSLFLGLEEIDATTKWRLLALDGRPGPFHTQGTRNMPEGDGRGVSGPPIDTATRYAMALRGRWADEFRRDVVDKLAEDDPIRVGIFDDNGEVKEIKLPLATDLVYQWGTRLDRPDWRKEYIRHLTTRANLAACRVVSTFTVPLHIPYGCRYLRLLGEDPGDDALLFTAIDRDSEQPLLICVERRSGSVRYIATLPPVDFNFAPKPNVGLFGGEASSDSQRFEAYISSRAFNHLCHGLDAALPRDRYLQKFGSFLNKGELFEGDIDNCGDHLDVARVHDDCIQWERLTLQTLEKERWNLSTPSHPVIRDVAFTEKYIFATAHHDYKRGPVDVYSRATGETVVRLMQRSPDHDVASLVYKFEQQEITEGIRRVELTPVDTNSEEYGDFLSELWSFNAYLGESQCLICNWLVSQRGAGVFSVGDGYLIIPHMQTVLDGASAIPREQRDAYIAARSVLVLIPESVVATQVVHGTLVLEDRKTDSLLLLCIDMPPITPDIPRPTIRGCVIATPPSHGRHTEMYFFGGYILETQYKPQSDIDGDDWGLGADDWMDPDSMILRFTSFEPQE